jgi:hypothetical protein
VLAVNQIVPVGDDVIDRTTRIAKRDAAIHTPCGLFAGVLVIKPIEKLAPMLDAHLWWLAGHLQTL